MAALYLRDGTTEVVAGDPQDTLQRLIGEYLGRDCEELFKGIMRDTELMIKNANEYKRDFEANADFYMGMCHDAVDGIEECIRMIDTSKRLDKQALRLRLKEIHDDIYQNL